MNANVPTVYSPWIGLRAADLWNRAKTIRCATTEPTMITASQRCTRTDFDQACFLPAGAAVSVGALVFVSSDICWHARSDRSMANGKYRGRATSARLHNLFAWNKQACP